MTDSLPTASPLLRTSRHPTHVSVGTSWSSSNRRCRLAERGSSCASEGCWTPASSLPGAPPRLAKHWADRGRAVKLALDAGAVDGLNGAEKMQLRDLANRWGILLEEGAAPQFANEAQLVAEVARSDQETLVFASRDPAACSGSAGWGHPDSAPVVRLVTPTALWTGRPVTADRLTQRSGASLRRVGSELDGPISTFGQRAGGLIRLLLEQLGVAKEDGVVAMSYEDRYLRAPLSLRLCLDTLAALNGGRAAVPVKSSTFRVPGRRPRPVEMVGQATGRSRTIDRL